MVITDATEDGHHLPLTMLKIMVLLLQVNIHTELLQDHAKNKVEVSKFHLLLQQVDALVFKMLFKENPSLSPLMHQSGVNIHQVF
jgi:hypothetical protein